MDILIDKMDAKYLWDNLLPVNGVLRRNNNNEQFVGGNSEEFYQLYDYENIVIKAVYNIKDNNAEMDSNEFCDWDNPDKLYIVSDGIVLEE